jgi:hypothetical protein
MHPAKYNYIIKKINELHDENVFILEKWDLETYLGMHQKWLAETVVFCHQYFQDRLKNHEFDTHRREFEAMLNRIFS